MMKPVKLLDALFLHAETPSTPMHVGALFVLDPPASRRREGLHARLTKLVAARLGASEIFTRCLAPVPLGLANPMWTTAGRVDLDHHVQRSVLPAPGSMRQLENRVAHLHEALLDRSRPLWELHVIDGLEGGRSALYVKTHHAGLDGHSAQLFLGAFADPDPRARTRPHPPPPASRQAPLEVIAASLRHQLRQVLHLPGRGLELASAAAGLLRARDAATPATPRTALNDVVTSRRSFGTFVVPIDEVKAIARATGTTLNDVVLAATSSVVRDWLVDHGMLPVQPMFAGVPVSMRAAGDTDHSIQVAFISVNLHTGIAAARARLAAIRESSVAAKDKAALSHSLIPDDVPSLGLPWLLGGLARLVGHREVAGRVPLPFNLIVSNVPGPRHALHVAGQRAVTYLPISIVYHGVGLNVSVYSYDDRLFFGLTACPDLLPDVQAMAGSIGKALAALAPGVARARPRTAGKRRRGTA